MAASSAKPRTRSGKIIPDIAMERAAARVIRNTEDKRALARDLFMQGKHPTEIGKILDCSVSCIRVWMREGRWREALTGQHDGRMTKKVSDEILNMIRERYLMGDSPERIAQDFGFARTTVQRWIREGGWRKLLSSRRSSIDQLELEINRLIKNQPLSEGDARKISMLSKAVDRLRRAAPKPKPKPTVAQAVHAELLQEVLKEEYGLFAYQREFLQSEARYRCILKARQIGFSFVLGLACVLGAMAGRNQLIVSASKDQSDIVLGYALSHMNRLGLAPDADPTSDVIPLGGVEIRSLPANFRTVQGRAGDLWLDEFAWHLKPERIWSAILPSITQVGGRVTVCSTPFVPGNLFWKLAENHKGQWSHFERTRITIHDAVAQGMPIPGGIDELRLNFDSESWHMFYECQWAEDGSALLPWSLLQELAVPDIRVHRVGRLTAGVDVGRLHDRTAIAIVGERLDPVASSQYLEDFVLAHHEQHKNLPFEQQKQLIMGLDRRNAIEEWRLDKTGLGMQLAEELEAAIGSRVRPTWFTAPLKERLALNVLKLAEDKKLILPNNPDLLASLHAVKKFATQKGVRYDADRNDAGHADAFWALALALDGRGPRGGGGCELLMF